MRGETSQLFLLNLYERICTDTQPELSQANPYTGAAFPNNQIPSGMITSQAKTLITYLPKPTTNSPGLPNEAPNYFSQVSAARDFNAYDFRFDYQISTKDNFTIFATKNVGSHEPNHGLPTQLWERSDFGYGRTSTTAETHIFQSQHN